MIQQNHSATDVDDTTEKVKRKNNYWSKLERREREGFNPPKSGTQTLGKVFGLQIVLRIGFAIAAIVCPSIFLFLQSDFLVVDISGPPPEEVAITQLTAIFNGDLETMRLLTCSSLEDEWESVYQKLESQVISYGISEFQFDLSNMQASVTQQSARRTVVELTGELAISVGGERVTMDIEELLLSQNGQEGQNVMTLIVQGGRWVVCST
jgi:hypothetical protein